MNAKLVYILTCASDKYYIEQTLISAFSARHWNPDVHIVLMVDDETNLLLQGKRAEILKYITEKIVVPFEDASLSPMYRSRFIKTSVRQRIKGDFLFIDSDTLCQRSLNDIDNFDCEVGAVLESHLEVKDYCDGLRKSAKNVTSEIGLNIDEEKLYFSSGVLYVKDTNKAHKLYELWHQYWQDGNEKGLKIDQPSLGKANRESGHIIKQIPDTYNCILFTRPPFVREAHILHIAAYLNPSFLFTKQVLEYVRENGIGNEWLQQMILNPCATMMPFDYNLKYSTWRERRQWCKELSEALRGYGVVIDKTYFFNAEMCLNKRDVFLLKRGMVRLAIWEHLLEYYLRLKRKDVKSNMCAK